MPIKHCEICGKEFKARLSRIRTCGITCRNRLIAAAKVPKHTKLKYCLVCDAPYSVTASEFDRKTCSTGCSYKLRSNRRKDRVVKTCKTCGKPYEVVKNAAKTSNYCSKKCMYARNESATIRTCVVCGKEFHSSPCQMHVKTCSTECGYKARIDPREKEKIEIVCGHCGKTFFEHESRAEFRIYCSKKCMFASEQHKQKQRENVSGEKNPSWKGGLMRSCISASGNPYRRQSSEKETEKAVRRKRAKGRATPAWANINKMRAIYGEAQRLSKETGIRRHVDHIVPLISMIVCGLHCEVNLQIITARENLQKHNRTWPDMP